MNLHRGGKEKSHDETFLVGHFPVKFVGVISKCFSDVILIIFYICDFIVVVLLTCIYEFLCSVYFYICILFMHSFL